MSCIIRLQNLPWSANANDIRLFFMGLSIPQGGVRIVGGELGDAFITFRTNEDAQRAMEKAGDKLKGVPVKLLLSTQTQMDEFEKEAEKMISSALKKERDQKNRESRRRSRSRPMDRTRSRRDSRDSGLRRRSRSRDRSSRDQYGRDQEKEVETGSSQEMLTPCPAVNPITDIGATSTAFVNIASSAAILLLRGFLATQQQQRPGDNSYLPYPMTLRPVEGVDLRHHTPPVFSVQGASSPSPDVNSSMGNHMQHFQQSNTRGGGNGGSFRGSDRFGRFSVQNWSYRDRLRSFGPGPGFNYPRRDMNNRKR